MGSRTNRFQGANPKTSENCRRVGVRDIHCTVPVRFDALGVDAGLRKPSGYTTRPSPLGHQKRTRTGAEPLLATVYPSYNLEHIINNLNEGQFTLWLIRKQYRYEYRIPIVVQL